MWEWLINAVPVIYINQEGTGQTLVITTKTCQQSKIFLLYTSRAQKAKIMYMGQLYQGDKKQHLCIRECFGKCNRRSTTPVSLPPGKSIIKKELDDSTS